ncbi:hypothetical protein BXZ70DRAFT_926135 [Cristinia sonorae]|uniref:Zinc finger protein n=1 Tax=Cristinia sonorae TaxID=1940300 RepID=A0A8K0UUG1_9AGAR|nr:hypothetical protein BXZ70DRAFT_926135 [Cristinia sonorae]
MAKVKIKCDQCEGRIFYSESSYENHLKSNDRHKLHCPATGCSYSSHLEEGLRSHFNAKHPAVTLYSCEHCSAKFTSKSNLQAHMSKTHADKLCRCPRCEDVFLSVAEMNSHCLVQHLRRECSICRCGVYEADWEEHVAKTPAHWLCDQCVLSFDDEKAYLRHSSFPHNELYCTTCDRHFHTPDLLDEHRRGLPDHYMCDDCGIRYSASWLLACHVKLRHSDASATFVPTTSRSSILANKEGTRDLTPGGSVNALSYKPITALTQPSCAVCNQSFKTERDLQQHSMAKHPERYGADLGSRGPVRCDTCDVDFKGQLALQQHILFQHPAVDRGTVILDAITSVKDGDGKKDVWSESSVAETKVASGVVINSASSSTDTFMELRSEISVGLISDWESELPTLMSPHEDTQDPQSANPLSNEVGDAVSGLTNVVSQPGEIVPAVATDAAPATIHDDSSHAQETTTSLAPNTTHTATHTVPSPIPSAQPVLPVMRCGCCKSSPTDTLVTMCGHVFCHGCVMAEISKTLQCPTCKRPMFVRIDFGAML